ncbi:hypothetical protein AB5I41_31085 [Sphingomonas sp. MMS24-JH45]
MGVLVVTIIGIGSVFAPSQPPRGYGDIGSGIVGVFHLLFALIVSLVAWLIWALTA